VASGSAGAGDVVQVAYVLALVSFPVRSLGWVLGELPRTVVGWRRMALVLDAVGAMDYGTGALTGTRAAPVRADRVDYAYPGRDAAGREELLPVLHRVSLDVRAGSTVAVVGPTGSGKSTLASVLLRLVDPLDGRVLLDGVDLRTLRHGQLAGSAVLVAQIPFVFEDTVRDNITLGADVDDAAVWRALEAAAVADTVRSLPQGLDTRLGERGTTLSGGQRQRIALARALVRRPRLLVLDDATSAVDPRVEAQILAGLRAGLLGEVTVLVIAYRMATITLADEVIYLEHGRVAGRGSHEDLQAGVPGYRALVTAYQRDAADRARVRAEQEPS
jgi:ABC-type multidrug transport system fused ATPase/permease subunit